ncbi:MAG: hypothetical protein Tsb009_18560 [Planctomycetaceae bacterium]
MPNDVQIISSSESVRDDSTEHSEPGNQREFASCASDYSHDSGLSDNSERPLGEGLSIIPTVQGSY